VILLISASWVAGIIGVSHHIRHEHTHFCKRLIGSPKDSQIFWFLILSFFWRQGLDM
jgi:hypothetical protein